MNKLISINPTGLFTYGLHKTIPLDNLGVVLLDGKNLDRHGGSNGSGKSSLFHCITQILFGKNPVDENTNEVINATLGKVFNRLIFEDKYSNRWRITEVKKWRKSDTEPDSKLDHSYVREQSEWVLLGNSYSGTDVFLEQWDPGTQMWLDRRSTNSKAGDVRLDLKATRKKIVEILEMDFDQFMAVAYMAQERTMKFMAGTHKEKMEVISNISDIKVWDSRIGVIKDELKVNRSELDRLQAKYNGLIEVENSIQKIDPDEEPILKASIEGINIEIINTDTKISSVKLQQSENELKIQGVQSKIDDQIRLSRIIQVELNKANSMMADVADTFNTKYAEMLNRPEGPESSILEIKLNETNGMIQARRYDLEQLMTSEGKCPKCRTNVQISHILRHRELLDNEIQEYQGIVDDTKIKLIDLKDKREAESIELLNAIKTERAEAEAIANDCLLMVNGKIKTNSDLIDTLKKEKMDLQYNAYAGAIKELELQRLMLLSSKSLNENKLKDITAIRVKYDEYIKSKSNTHLLINETTKQIKYLEIIERMFGDKGIKAYKLDNILALLNHTVQQYIDIITDGNVKVSVSQYREKADGDTTTDIQIMVSEGIKQSVPYKLYSGGERRQIGLAFIGAFWHIASLAGVGVNILCMDETFGPLDPENAEYVFKYINTLKGAGKSTIFIVTHDAIIKDKVGIDKQWTIVKKNHMSEVTYEN